MTLNAIDTPARSPGRPREFDMDLALDQAARVFSERGFHATSINDLSEAMELTAGSIYKAFKDKRSVFIAALERQSASRTLDLMQALSVQNTGNDKVRAALTFYASASCGVMGKLGCLVVGTAMELSTFDADIAERVIASIRTRERMIAELIRLGQTDGTINTALDVKATARCLLCLMHGLRVVGKTSPPRAEMLATVDIAMKMLD